MVEKLVRDVMHLGVITCRTDTSLKEAARILTEHEINALIVVDRAGDACGVLSQTDLVKVYDRGWETMTVEEVMTPQVMSISADVPVSTAVRMMVENRIHRLLIMEGGSHPRRPMAILSMSDIVREMAEG